MYDLVITGGRVVDGSGDPAFDGFVAVRDGRIADVGRQRPLPEECPVLDAAGKIVAPGFIDLHSHADFTILGAPGAVTQLAQGVTTALLGNCGMSPFPIESVAQARAEYGFIGNGLVGDWQDAHGFMSALRDCGLGINVVLQVGMGAIRSKVVGQASRPAAPAETARMQDEIRYAAEVGVRGFSTGLIYTPQVYSDASEIEQLVATAQDCGLLYSTHMRDETAHLLEAVDEALSTAERTGCRLEISHLKAMGLVNHGLPVAALERIEQAHGRGVDVAVDVYPYTASSTRLTSRLSPEALDGGADALLARLADKSQRERIARTLAARFGVDIDPDGVIIAGLGDPRRDESYDWSVGHSLTEIAEKEGCSPEEAALLVLEAHGGTVSIVNHAMAESDVDAILQHPLVSVASDGAVMDLSGHGLPHPRSFGTFVRVLGRYVRERGVISIEEAIRKMTSLPASRLGLGDRGVLRVGAIADISVFSPESVVDNSTFVDPWKLASGVSDVLLAGRFALRAGKLADARLGTVL